MNHERGLINEVIFVPLQNTHRFEDTTIISSDGWFQVINPSFAEVDRNEIVICDQKISDSQSFFESKRDEYFDRNLPFKWCWNPLSRPVELEKVLKSNCDKSWDFSGMAINPSDFKTELPNDVLVEEVSKSNLDDYLDVFMDGWKISGRDKVEAACLDQLNSEKQTSFYFVSYVGEIPAGAAKFTLFEKSGYLGGAIVLEEFRGRGLYKALLKGRLEKLKELGIPTATTQARDHTSTPVLEKLRFSKVFSGKIYQFNPPRTEV